MDKSKMISDFVKMSKGDKRLANKKRKAEVLLNLLFQKQKFKNKSREEVESSSSTNNMTESEEESDVSPAKKSRLDNVHECSDSESSDNTPADTIEDRKPTKMEKKKQKRLRLKEIKLQIKKIQKLESKGQERPIFHLMLKELLNQQQGNKPGPVPPDEELPPLYMLDLQHLLMLGLLPDSYINYPRWCKLVRPGRVVSVVVIVLDQLSASDLEEYQECFPFMKKTFQLFAGVVSTYQYDTSVMKEVFRVPVSIRTLKKISWNKDSQRDTLKQQLSEISRHVGHQPGPDEIEIPTTFNRRQLLLNPLQLMHEGYPLPIKTLQDRYKDFRFSYNSYKAVTKKSPMFAIDCEMCLTSTQQNELTRISVINEKLETVYDTLVKPHNKIVNYLTRYSGITKQMLDPVRTRLANVQNKLRQYLPSDSIWVGQSLNNDLVALKLFHPYVIDTSVIYNLSGFKWKKTGLRVLTAKFLNQDIQTGSEGHCSVEDARATMELVQLKLKKGMTFGDATQGAVISEDRDELEVKGQCELVRQTNKDTEEKQSDVTQAVIGSNEPVESEDKSQCDTVQGVMDEKEGERPLISRAFDKRKLFFQQQKGRYQSFFTLAKNGNKSAVVIDREDEISDMDLDKDPGVKCVAETSDRARTLAAATAVQNEDFVWVQLHGLSRLGEGAESREEEGTADTGEENTTAVSDRETSLSKEEGRNEQREENRTAGEADVALEAEKDESGDVAGTTKLADDNKDVEEGEIIENMEKKKCLKRIDKRVKKIVQNVRSRSLLCVVLSGQSNKDRVLNGGVLIKIT